MQLYFIPLIVIGALLVYIWGAMIRKLNLKLKLKDKILMIGSLFAYLLSFCLTLLYLP
jgi:hypothetical protein